MTRHGKSRSGAKGAGYTHYRRIAKGIGVGNGGHLNKKRRVWCERNKLRVDCNL